MSSDYQLAYVSRAHPLTDDKPVLLCDPLTRLVAYPSFEQHLTEMLPTLARDGVHLAIGDVDGLREYVTERRTTDPTAFGHLAGNECMRQVGELTNEWASAELGAGWNFRLCGTFGGDEVIVVATGYTHEHFLESVNRLCDKIRFGSPRPCSFAVGTLARHELAPDLASAAYRHFVSQVDSALFEAKEKRKADGVPLDAQVWTVGHVSALHPAHDAGS
nr:MULTISPECIES: GGDEF domain-containing protein [Streptomyces]